MRISTKGKYALEALTYMGSISGNPPQSIRVLSDKLDVSEKYLEQIFFILRKARILDTKRGPAGGYFISVDLSSLTAGDVVRAAQGEIEPVACLTDKDSCEKDKYDNCVTRYLWSRLTCAISGVLDTVTIEMLADSYNELLASG